MTGPKAEPNGTRALAVPVRFIYFTAVLHVRRQQQHTYGYVTGYAIRDTHTDPYAIQYQLPYTHNSQDGFCSLRCQQGSGRQIMSLITPRTTAPNAVIVPTE